MVHPPKPSGQYLKKQQEDGADVFCKISSHHGDVDNDPHTPRSNGSAGEKRVVRHRVTQQFPPSHKQDQPMSPLFICEDIGETPGRISTFEKEDFSKAIKQNRQLPPAERYEVIFEGDADLLEMEEKFTSRDVNFSRLRQ